MAKFFGLDIGSQEVKVLQAEKVKQGFKVVHFAKVKTEPSKDMAVIIKAAVKEAGIRGAEVNIALPESDVYTRIVQTPRLSQTELASAIQYEAEQYVPIALEEVNLYHQVLEKSGNAGIEAEGKMNVLLIAVSKERLKKLMTLLDNAGLMPKSLETELFSLSRVFTDVNKSQMLVSFGHRTTDLISLKNGVPLIIYSFPTGGMALTKALSSELSLSMEEAEQYKCTYGLQENMLEGKIARLLMPLIDELTNQIKKTYVFIQQKKQPLPEELIITGGGALLPGLTGYLTKKLNVGVVVGDPLMRLVKDEKFKKMIGKESNPELATVTGLALKGLV